jgi:2-polyprenyl-3-methyl-5-hydroxy-6-metoxy-1,4-benzoquinol methylase
MTSNTPALDETRVEQFAGRLLVTYTEATVTLMIDAASRTGLLEALAVGDGTSVDVAGRGGLVERYVRVCLGSLVTAGIVEFDPTTRRYALPPEHAACLTRPGSLNLAAFARLNTLLARHVDGVTRAFREGGGVPYEDFRPESTDVMDGLNRSLLHEQLAAGSLPATGDLPARLDAGTRVADIGCGTGHAVNLLTRTYPRSRFTGYDLAADAIERGRAEAAEWELANASFHVSDVRQLPIDPPFGAVFAFDAIHDQADPAGVLAGCTPRSSPAASSSCSTSRRPALWRTTSAAPSPPGSTGAARCTA